MSNRLNAAAALLAASAASCPPPPRPRRSCCASPTSTAIASSSPTPATSGRAPATGGTATRLTAHPGLELFPKFSPDGKWIAFTGQYDGDEQVYVIPAEGGEPRQLTYYPARGPLPPRWGYDNQVYRLDARRQGDPLPLACATPTASAPRASSTRSPLTGGLADGAARCPTRARATSRPTASGSSTRRSSATSAPGSATRAAGRRTSTSTTSRPTTRSRSPPACAPSATRCGSATRIYFASDRDGTLNLYSYDLDDRRGRAAHAAARPGTCAGRRPTTPRASSTSWTASCASSTSQAKADQALSITVPERRRRDAAVALQRREARSRTSSSAPRASGRCSWPAATSSRLPIEKGPTRNLTDTSSAHDKWARWSPDGKRIAFISDRSGEDEIWLVAQDGRQARAADERPARRCATRPSGRRTASASRSPTRTASSSSLTLADKKVVEVADDERGKIRDYAWSPKGDCLAFSMTDANESRSLHIWSAADGKLHRVTDEVFNEDAPGLGPGGQVPLLPLRPRVRAADQHRRVELRRRPARPASSP